MRVRVRQARLEDLEAVYRFHRALYLEHRGAIMPEGMEILFAYREFPQVLREDVESMLHGEASVVLIAEDVDVAPHPRAIGYASGSVQNDPRRVLSRKGILGDWFVAEDARGGGVGRRLVEVLFAIFEESGCSIVETSTWTFNEETRAAMEALGFREIQVTYRREL